MRRPTQRRRRGDRLPRRDARSSLRRFGRVGAFDGRADQGRAFSPFARAAPTLPEFFASVRSRTPIVCEIKSEFDGDFRLAERVAALAVDYPGPLALKSFDPDVVATLRVRYPGLGPAGAPCPIGIVAEASYEDPDWRFLTADQKRDMRRIPALSAKPARFSVLEGRRPPKFNALSAARDWRDAGDGLDGEEP